MSLIFKEFCFDAASFRKSPSELVLIKAQLTDSFMGILGAT